jgi:hypothetical protein
MIIDEEAEAAIDWDWYAVDEEGHVGHFTSAGMRKLPRSVKRDQEVTDRIRCYFFQQAPVIGSWSVRAEAEVDCGGWARQGSERYLQDFAHMASKGLFSFDTETRTEKGRYFLVAIPERILRVTELPADIGHLVLQTHAPLRFLDCAYIDSRETEAW